MGDSGRLISAAAAARLWERIGGGEAAVFCNARVGRTLQKPEWRDRLAVLGIEVRQTSDGWRINRNHLLRAMHKTLSDALARVEEEMRDAARE